MEKKRFYVVVVGRETGETIKEVGPFEKEEEALKVLKKIVEDCPFFEDRAFRLVELKKSVIKVCKKTLNDWIDYLERGYEDEKMEEHLKNCERCRNRLIKASFFADIREKRRMISSTQPVRIEEEDPSWHNVCRLLEDGKVL